MEVRGVVLDTNAYGAFKQGLPEAVDVIRHVPIVGLCSIVLGELRGGFALGSREHLNHEELQNFIGRSRVRLLAVDDPVARQYARVYRNLKQKGLPIPTNDMWIAATALHHDLAVFSYDHHFQYVDGLVAGAGLDDFIA